MIHYTKTVRFLLFIGASLATLKGAVSLGLPTEPINVYTVAAAQMYVENNMPTLHSSFARKTARACEVAVTQPRLCCLTFFGWDCFITDLRDNYSNKKMTNLLLGGLPIARRSDRLQISQAFDNQHEEAVIEYWKCDTQQQPYIPYPSEAAVRGLATLTTIGAGAAFALCGSPLSWMVAPCCAFSAASCCLARCVAVTDRL